MTESGRLKALLEVYRIHGEFVSGFGTVCRKACAHCCTRNVVATALEARLILQHLEAEGLAPVSAAAESPRFQPRTTINQLAAMCAKGLDIPEEAAEPTGEPCPFLHENVCRIYEARPFGCRAMVSLTDCAAAGEATMPDYILTVNHVFLQYIEALDAAGIQGNLIDVLLFSAFPETPGLRVVKNHALSALMVPPEHRQRIRPLLDALSRAANNG